MSTAFSIHPPDQTLSVFHASVSVGPFAPLPSCHCPPSLNTALGSLSVLVFPGLLLQCVCPAACLSRRNLSWPCSRLMLPQCFLGMTHMSQLFHGLVLIPSPLASLCLFNYNLEFQERCITVAFGLCIDGLLSWNALCLPLSS